MPRSTKHLLVLPLYVLITLGMTYPAFLWLPVALVGDHVDSYLNTWIIAWGAHKLAAGEFTSLFNANIFFPYPNTLAYSEHMLGNALLALPLQWFNSPVVTYNVSVLLAFILSALAMYLLVRHLTGNGYAAFISGLVFSFFPWRFSHLPHLQLLSAQWLPLTFLFLHRFTRSGAFRELGWAACFFVLTFYSCGYYGLFLTLFIIVFALLYWRPKDVPSLQSLQKIGLVLGGSFLAILPVTLPYLRLKRDFGFSRPLDDAVFFSADLLTFLSMPAQNWLWGSLLERFRKPEGDLFMGVFPLLLALIGLLAAVHQNQPAPAGSRTGALCPRSGFIRSGGRPLRLFILLGGVLGGLFLLADALPLAIGGLKIGGREVKILGTILLPTTVLFFAIRPWREKRSAGPPCFSSPEARFYAALLGFSFLLALGPVIHLAGRQIAYGPYLALYQWIPGFNGLRVPARIVVMMHLAVSVFCGCGLAVLLARISRPWLKRSLVSITALLILLEYATVPIPMPSVPSGKNFPQVYTWLAAQPGDFAVLELPLPTQPAELWSEAAYVYHSAYHWKKLVNGYSGFFPPGYTRFYLEDMKGFPSRQTLERIRATGLLRVIIHADQYQESERENIKTCFAVNPDLFRLEQQFDGDWVYRVNKE